MCNRSTADGEVIALFELKDGLIDSQAIAGGGVNRGDHPVALGAHDIFHFHGLNDGQFLARLDRLANRHRHRRQQARHWRQ